MSDAAAAYAGTEGLRRFRRELTDWLDANEAALLRSAPGASQAEEVERTRANQRQLWDAGWLRYGWPASVGGLGGSSLLRAAVAEAAARRGLFFETVFAVTEVLGPAVFAAAPELAAEFAQPFLRGDVGWCQGFSEPEAGSDLASLRCRAVDAGDHWVVTGQKVWTSYAQFATQVVLLARTGPPDSRHRGITAMLVDMDWPGVTTRPLPALNQPEEFSEMFFDAVKVPKQRLIGAENGGWGVAMDILRSERGAIFWMLSGWLLEELHAHVDEAELAPEGDAALGSAFLSIAALRSRCWSTQHRLDAGELGIPETSIDKILMASAEQELFDWVHAALPGVLEFGDDPAAADLRSSYFYSRAASIYGGTAEIQRNIVADQLLGLRDAR